MSTFFAKNSGRYLSDIYVISLNGILLTLLHCSSAVYDAASSNVGIGSFTFVMTGESVPPDGDISLLKSNQCWSSGLSFLSLTIALTGHSGSQIAQSIQIAGSITNVFSNSKKQSTGQTLTQVVCLQSTHSPFTTYVN